jgi:hypothetical protein
VTIFPNNNPNLYFIRTWAAAELEVDDNKYGNSIAIPNTGINYNIELYSIVGWEYIEYPDDAPNVFPIVPGYGTMCDTRPEWIKRTDKTADTGLSIWRSFTEVQDCGYGEEYIWDKESKAFMDIFGERDLFHGDYVDYEKRVVARLTKLWHGTKEDRLKYVKENYSNEVFERVKNNQGEQKDD